LARKNARVKPGNAQALRAVLRPSDGWNLHAKAPGAQRPALAPQQ
jgi:hypothetical protein